MKLMFWVNTAVEQDESTEPDLWYTQHSKVPSCLEYLAVCMFVIPTSKIYSIILTPKIF